MARIANEVREAIHAKIQPVRKSEAKKKEKEVKVETKLTAKEKK